MHGPMGHGGPHGGGFHGGPHGGFGPRGGYGMRGSHRPPPPPRYHRRRYDPGFGCLPGCMMYIIGITAVIALILILVI